MNIKITGTLMAMWTGLFICSGLLAHQKEPSEMSQEHTHWMAPADAASRSNPIPYNQVSIATGKKLFEKHCASCHGHEGRGDGPLAARLNRKPANLVQMAGHHSDGDIAWKITNGRGPMPAWKGVLSDMEIWHLTNFVQSLAETQHSH